MPKVQKKEEIALKILWCICFSSIQLYQRHGVYAFYIAYIIEFSRFNTPFRCGKF